MTVVGRFNLGVKIMTEKDLDRLTAGIAGLIMQLRRVVVFTGAGVSTESSIPDFRSPGGIWQRFDPRDFTSQKFISDVEARRRQWRLFRQLSLTAEPNPAHIAVAELYRLGRLDCVITQNVDNLHQTAGIPDDKVFELHGSMRRFVCLTCHRYFPVEQIVGRFGNGEEVPDCEICHGILKPDAVLFGEPLPEEVFQAAIQYASHCDLLLVIGSTLTVYPAASIPECALNAGARLVIINLSPTPLDGSADFVVRIKAGEFMPMVVQRVKDSVD
jgi:NAD-dependent deacetylase